LVSFLSFISGLEEKFSIGDDDDLEDEKGESDENESEDLTTSVCYYESIVNVGGALFGCSSISEDGNSHSDVAWDDGGEATNNEGSCCVELSKMWLDGEYEKDGEEYDEAS